ncbi:hypothetical protein [Prochlorococcus sp. MIT 1303]|uniref:hypothetical protein n=1 Tax=Prochlorococcus sp. MIT 1303 TaxID=1723647 RepID=UPI0012E874D4|nr:hypothetical protein [Prochlorococcus sp. MIT 1303]
MLTGRIVGVNEPIQLHYDVLEGEPAGTLHAPLASWYEFCPREKLTKLHIWQLSRHPEGLGNGL